MARTATGIDIGTSTAKLLRGEVKNNSFVVTDFAVAENDGGTLESGWAALRGVTKPTVCCVGVTGREVNMRYTRVPRLPDWQLKKLMRFETEEISGQSEASVASDFNVLPEIPEIEGEDVVLLCMARESLLKEHMTGLGALGGQLEQFTPNAVGLYNAFLHFGVVMEDTVLVANLGRENLDVILVRGTDLLFARNLQGGSKLLDEALAQRFGISGERAARYKEEEGTLNQAGPFSDSNQEKGCRAMMGPAGQILSLLQSTLLFAKSQIKLNTLKLDRVLLCGGGSALDGLPEYLSKGLSVPVELFDPFVVVDTGKLAPEAADLLEDHKLEAVCALGLATTASASDAYSIEILPESLRKRREFLGGAAFLIAAAALAVLYLGLYAWKSKERLGEYKVQVAGLESKFKRADRSHRETVTLLDANAAAEDYANELFALAGSGEQLVRALDAVERHLPSDFWLESLTSTWSADTDLNVPLSDERPILEVRGKAREGTDSPTILFQEFIGQLRQELPEAEIKDRFGDTAAFFTIELTMLAPRAVDESEDSSGEEG